MAELNIPGIFRMRLVDELKKLECTDEEIKEIMAQVDDEMVDCAIHNNASPSAYAWALIQ